MTFGYEHRISEVKTLHALAEIDDPPGCSVPGKSRIWIARINTKRHRAHVVIVCESYKLST